jgi:hypothetical protein
MATEDWAGALMSGLTTGIGIAAGNDYLVAGGTGMAMNYNQQMNSLLDEQRTNRLADVKMEREKNLKRWEYSQPWNVRQRQIADQKLSMEEEKHGALMTSYAGQEESRKLTNSLNQKKLDDLSRTPEEKAQEQLGVWKILQEGQATFAAEQSAAQKATTLADQKAALAASNLKPEVRQMLEGMLELQAAGIDTSTLMSKEGKAKQLTSESFTKIKADAETTFRDSEEYEKIKIESGSAAAETAALEWGLAAAIQSNQIYSNLGGQPQSIFVSPGQGQRQIDVTKLIDKITAEPQHAQALQQQIDQMGDSEQKMRYQAALNIAIQAAQAEEQLPNADNSEQVQQGALTASDSLGYREYAGRTEEGPQWMQSLLSRLRNAKSATEREYQQYKPQ